MAEHDEIGKDEQGVIEAGRPYSYYKEEEDGGRSQQPGLGGKDGAEQAIDLSGVVGDPAKATGARYMKLIVDDGNKVQGDIGGELRTSKQVNADGADEMRGGQEGKKIIGSLDDAYPEHVEPCLSIDIAKMRQRGRNMTN